MFTEEFPPEQNCFWEFLPNSLILNIATNPVFRDKLWHRQTKSPRTAIVVNIGDHLNLANNK